MEHFNRVITAINNIVWHPVMLVFLSCAAIWFTIQLKGMQFTRIRDMLKYLFEKGENSEDTSLSPFQAFATTVGGRIGTGSVAGTYNVAADEIGNVLLVENAPGVMYGVSFMQQAMSTTIGQIGPILLAVMLFLFIYTTQLSYSYQLESTCRFLFGENRRVVTVIRIVFLAFCLFGVLVDGTIIWPMGDIGVGLMLWVNTFGILLLTPQAVALVKDCEKQRALGLDPLFDPATVGISDPHGIWAPYVEKKKARGDYENPSLGY